METNNKRLELNENVVMCSGVCCKQRGRCYRYRLDYFYGNIAREPHPNPQWSNPSYNEKNDSCPFFRKTIFRESK